MSIAYTLYITNIFLVMTYNCQVFDTEFIVNSCLHQYILLFSYLCIILYPKTNLKLSIEVMNEYLRKSK